MEVRPWGWSWSSFGTLLAPECLWMGFSLPRELYVNDFSEDLGDVGRAAIDELLRRGRSYGLLPEGGSAYREPRT